MTSRSNERGLAIERVHATVEASRGLGRRFVLTARTEGFIRGRPDLDETLRRLTAFEAAGADVLYAPGTLEAAREVLQRGTFGYLEGLPTVMDFNDLIDPRSHGGESR
jgi:hypothetical protein